MFIHAIPLMLAMLGGSSDGFSPGGEEQEFYRVLADYQAVRSLAELDLATIVKKDAADLALLHLIPDESSGASLKDGYLSQRSKGWVFPAQEIAKYRGRAGIITKGDWERVGSIAASANAKPKGMYDWLDKSSGASSDCSGALLSAVRWGVRSRPTLPRQGRQGTVRNIGGVV